MHSSNNSLKHMHCTCKFTKSSLVADVFGEIVLCTKILPIMLALCLMLLPSFYAQNYAGIIGSSLLLTFVIRRGSKRGSYCHNLNSVCILISTSASYVRTCIHNYTYVVIY